MCVPKDNEIALFCPIDCWVRPQGCISFEFLGSAKSFRTFL